MLNRAIPLMLELFAYEAHALDSIAEISCQLQCRCAICAGRGLVYTDIAPHAMALVLNAPITYARGVVGAFDRIVMESGASVTHAWELDTLSCFVRGMGAMEPASVDLFVPIVVETSRT